MKRLLFFSLLFFITFSSSNREVNQIEFLEYKKTGILSRLLATKNSTLLPAKSVLNKAILGFEKLKKQNNTLRQNKLVLIDYSLHSSKKRMWILNLDNGKILNHCYVAHGKNSGKEMASSFSNQPESHKSSLGFFITGNTYMGKHGLSLILEGQEKNFNDLAKQRSIVMHGAAYVSEEIVAMQGYLGRSFGCPALPEALSEDIINSIKEGTALFIYGEDQEYISHSTLLNN